MVGGRVRRDSRHHSLRRRGGPSLLHGGRNLFGCNMWALAVALKNYEDETFECVFTDFCDYADECDVWASLFVRSLPDIIVLPGAIVAADGAAGFLPLALGMLP